MGGRSLPLVPTRRGVCHNRGVSTLESGLVRWRIAQLRRDDREHRRFGASAHRYRFPDRLTEQAVASFEGRFGVRLPDDYRTFLTEVGNGGPGPEYGVLPLGHHAGRDGQAGFEEYVIDNDPGKPFPHTAGWNVPLHILNAVRHLDHAPTTPRFAGTNWLEEAIWAPGMMNGTIPICDTGCGIYLHLVVSEGNEFGHVWVDGRANDGGIQPVPLRDRPRVTFAEWYLDWLERERRSPRRD